MLKTRPVREGDIEEIRRLHYEFYPEFRFPDFYHLLCGWVIEDETGEIVVAGGVETCAELLTVSNQTKSNIKVGRALRVSQGVAGVTCEKFGINNLYAFTNRPIFARHLVQHGFSERHEQTLRLGIPNGR